MQFHLIHLFLSKIKIKISIVQLQKVWQLEYKHLIPNMVKLNANFENMAYH